METTTFTALAERAGRWWTVRVPQIEGLAVQVRSLDQAEMMARRHISEALHVPPESVRVEVRTEASVLPAVTKALQARQAAAQAAEAAVRATRSAIEALLVDGSTLQEAAIVLRLSPEEVAGFASGAHGPAGALRASGGPGSLGGAPGGHDVSGGHGAAGGHGAPGGPRASHGHGDAEPPVGPGGLPQRTRSAGPAAVHH
ncbi:MAG TPA: hypothetical protein VI365_16890 [Trebonia sp.]